MEKTQGRLDLVAGTVTMTMKKRIATRPMAGHGDRGLMILINAILTFSDLSGKVTKMVILSIN